MCMYNGQKFVTWPPIARINARKAEHDVTKYKIRPLNINGRENAMGLAASSLPLSLANRLSYSHVAMLHNRESSKCCFSCGKTRSLIIENK